MRVPGRSDVALAGWRSGGESPGSLRVLGKGAHDEAHARELPRAAGDGRHRPGPGGGAGRAVVRGPGGHVGQSARLQHRGRWGVRHGPGGGRHVVRLPGRRAGGARRPRVRPLLHPAWDRVHGRHLAQAGHGGVAGASGPRRGHPAVRHQRRDTRSCQGAVEDLPVVPGAGGLRRAGQLRGAPPPGAGGAAQVRLACTSSSGRRSSRRPRR